MAHQKSKKNAAWLTCELCNSIILHKDKESHTSSDCPPNLDNIKHNFIYKNTLYGSLETKSIEVKSLSSREVDNLVFLSQSAIQLCELSIGDWAIIEALDGADREPPVAKVVWPTCEKTLTSVLMSKTGLNLSFMNIHNSVKVSKPPSNIPQASSVTAVALNAPKGMEITSELYNRIHKSNEGKYLTVGNKISIMFYGKVLKFSIKNITNANIHTDLESEFSKLLTVIENFGFCSITASTKWTIYRGENDYQRNNPTQKFRMKPAGVEDELNETREMIQAYFKTKQISSLCYLRSVLLYGAAGTGKTMIANYLARESNVNVVSICAPDLYSNTTSTAEDTVKERFQDAITHSPSIIILDEVDTLCPSRNGKLTDAEKRISSCVLQMLDKLNSDDTSKVFVIATTNKIDSIDASFRRPGRLEREIEIPTPLPKNRKAILQSFLRNVPNNLDERYIEEIAFQTHGFVGADIASLISQAGMNASRKNNNEIQVDDFKYALKKVRPSAMREVQIEVPNVKWCDIGGQEKLKLILRQAVEWPLKYSESFLRLGITPPKGVLMFGPPGCSKTMIAKALATESGLNFLSIKGPELFSKWVGESERAVREVFRKARQVAPSIIFFDEIDALGGERSAGSSTSVQERVLAQLLTELDGVSPLGDVTILAATNRPDRIDKALLRPGRLDRIVYVPLPDEKTRRDILRIKFSKMPVINVSIDDLVERTAQYSGAEITAVCHEAAMMALGEDIEAEYVKTRHFDEALKLITPRTPASLIKLYEDYLEIKI